MSGRPSPAWIRHVPNALSALRLLLAVVFPLLPPPWRLPAALGGGVSDLVDGFIARRFGVTSIAGALLDAIADKLLVLSVLVTLTVEGTIAWWQLLLVLARDLSVAVVASYTSMLRDWSAFGRMVPRPAGKLTTVLVFAWFVALLAPLSVIETPLFWLTAAASVAAGLDYLVRFAVALRGRSEA